MVEVTTGKTFKSSEKVVREQQKRKDHATFMRIGNNPARRIEISQIDNIPRIGDPGHTILAVLLIPRRPPFGIGTDRQIPLLPFSCATIAKVVPYLHDTARRTARQETRDMDP